MVISYLLRNLKIDELLPFGDVEIIRQNFDMLDMPFKFDLAIGVDPGQVHMGVCTLFRSGEWKDTIIGQAYEITFPSKQGLVERVEYTEKVLEYVFSISLPNKLPEKTVACVEQAAFGAPYGQAALAESRTAAVVSLLHNKITPRIAPPATIRKTVFGNGRKRAEEFLLWSDLKPNSASALACSLFAIFMEDMDEKEKKPVRKTS